MEGNDLINSLLRGSAEIDRMKGEIHQVLSMVLGWLSAEYTRSLHHRFDSKDCFWEIEKNAGKSASVVVRCFLDRSIEESGGFIGTPHLALTCVTKDKDVYFGGLEDVHKVREYLSVFVDGVAQEYMAIPKKWVPLLEAAKNAR